MVSPFHDLRKEYIAEPLLEATVHPDPLIQFETWFRQAVLANVDEPNAMTLATVSGEGQPTARVVLMKEISEGGFVFFTNYESRKGEELEHNSRACLLFFWQPLFRQVRIEGEVHKIDRASSVSYFQSRPKGSQIGAHVSQQSRPILSREELYETYIRLEEEYIDTAILPCPEHWGGYRLIPHYLEFWQGQENRLHDRIAYERKEEVDIWQVFRLAP